MNENEYLKKVENETSKFDMNELDATIYNSLTEETDDKFKGFDNCIVVMEECSELQQAISKALRGKKNYRTNLIEEIGDVLYGVRYLQKIFDISDEDILKSINVKIKRQQERNSK